MKATLISTDNEEVADLVGATHQLFDNVEPYCVSFADLEIVCKKGSIKSLPGNRVEMTSFYGYKYTFQII